MSKQLNDKSINVVTNIENWIASGRDVSINWGNSAVVNTMALGLLKATGNPWRYRRVAEVVLFLFNSVSAVR